MSVGGKTSNTTAKVFGKNFEKKLAVKQVRVSRSGIPSPNPNFSPSMIMPRPTEAGTDIDLFLCHDWTWFVPIRATNRVLLVLLLLLFWARTSSPPTRFARSLKFRPTTFR